MNSVNRPNRTELLVRAAFARLDVAAFAIATGCVGALWLAAATLMLLIKDAPGGREAGPHLALLAHFLPGYSVSWIGSAVGAAYGFLIGAALGVFIAAVWNIVHHILFARAVSSRYIADDF